MRSMLLCLLLASTGFAEVRDPTKLFSPRAVEEADRVIAGIRQATNGKDLIVEVIAELPANVRGRVNEPNFWEQLTANRAKDTGVDGIYVLISRQPSHVQGAVGNETQRVFSRDDRNRLIRIMADDFKAGNFDEGLLEGTRFVDQTVRANMPAVAGRTQSGAPAGPPAGPAPTRTNSRPSFFSGNVCLWVGLGLIAVFAISAFLRNRAAAQHGGYGRGGYGQGAYGHPGYDQGGGMGRGLLGGLLGGMAGGWLYDKFSRGGSDAHAAPPTDPSAGASPMGRDTSFDAGGGADFDAGPVESDGGGDFGGGDSGGGSDF